MHEYVFEIKATQVMFIRAEDEAAARKIVDESGDHQTRLVDGANEFRLLEKAGEGESGLLGDYLNWEEDEPLLIEIDGNDV